jgi:GNAT superfamily N-acetyltransferase
MDVSYYKSIAANSDLSGWKLMYCNEIPESIMENFIESANKCFSDLVSLNPFDVYNFSFTVKQWKETTEAMEKNGTTYGFNILFDRVDKIAGMCWILFDESVPKTLRHIGGFTAVIPKYRGLGIGKFLKAALYLRLLQENEVFKDIITDTMPWNTYMCRINEELGFKPFKKGCRFKFTNDFLNNYLNK